MRILPDLSLTFDDVILNPRRTAVSSRFNGGIDLSTEILPGLTLKYPIISANMDTVTEYRMAKEIHQFGGLGIIHRFMEVGLHRDQLKALTEEDIPAVGCIGVGSSDRISDLDLAGILIDVAHGHSDDVIKQIQNIKEAFAHIPIIAGNVATYEGAYDLFAAGANCVKVGVGPGSLCTTRVKTGNGVPQFTAIIECVKAAKDFGGTIIADGGIRDSGDIVKALAAGAHAVMVGSLVAGTEETPGRRANLSCDPGLYKTYRGMASKEAQISWKGKSTSVEGEFTYIPYRGAVADILKEFINEILSGMSYQSATNLVELRTNAVFRRQTSNGVTEGSPHRLRMGRR